MITSANIKAALEKWLTKLDKPEVASEFEGYNKTMQFVFPDIDYKIRMVFKDGKATLVDGIDDKAEMSLEISSEMFMGIADGSVDPMDSFMEGTLKPKGSMQDLEKLQIFMDDD
jgi:putative sterol carrier protein